MIAEKRKLFLSYTGDTCYLPERRTRLWVLSHGAPMGAWPKHEDFPLFV